MYLILYNKYEHKKIIKFKLCQLFLSQRYGGSALRPRFLLYVPYNIGRMPGFELELLPARCATNELHTSLIKLLNSNSLQIKKCCFTFCLRRVSNRTWLCLLIYRLRSMSKNLKINKTRSREANIVPSTAPSIKFIPLKI